MVNFIPPQFVIIDHIITDGIGHSITELCRNGIIADFPVKSIFQVGLRCDISENRAPVHSTDKMSFAVSDHQPRAVPPSVIIPVKRSIALSRQ